MKAMQHAALGLGFAFLYLPIVLVVLYSFNASRLVTVWGGFSTRWYGELFVNDQLMQSARISLEVAFVAGILATLLGTCAAVALVRFGRFKGRTLFASMIYAPLVMPEVIIGLALLLLFVALGLERGLFTVIIAHATLGLCYVAIIVRARLIDCDPGLEEAALDLGATPLDAFTRITLPLIMPAIAGGFLLAVTLSLDDLVIASFTTGPGATTLPMRIYSAVRLGVTPQINAMSSLLLAAVACGLGLAALALRRRRAS
ncbi:MAG TPA: ABC transporter permease subunit [Methylovirgula sp.]|jgi:putrescine transport system permease protein